MMMMMVMVQSERDVPWPWSLAHEILLFLCFYSTIHAICLISLGLHFLLRPQRLATLA